MEESQVKRGKGRPKKTIRKDIEVNELDSNMIFDRRWRHLIHVADPLSGIRLLYILDISKVIYIYLFILF